MNDDDVLTAVRDQRNKLLMTTPVEQVISRGRAVRAGRRIRRLAGTLAVVAAAAVALTVLLPANHQPTAQLTAWTVTRQANGTINVTIRELRDAAGLQSTLRADGVPASVTFGSEPNPSCREYPGRWNLSQSGVQLSNGSSPYILTIHPSALPRGAGVWLGGRFDFAYSTPGHPQITYISPRLPKSPVSKVVRVPVLGAGLVQASPQCTGS